MDRTLLKTLLVYSLILAGVYLLFKITLPFLSPIAWALIIGIITYPVYKRLLGLLKGHAIFASSLMTLTVALIFVLPVISLLSVLALEVGQVYDLVSSSLGSTTANTLLQQWSTNPHIAPYLEQLRSLLGGSDLNLTENIMSNSKAALSKLLGFLTSFLTNSFGFLMDMLFMLFILFFVYLDGERAVSRLKQMLPLEPWLQQKISTVIQNVLSGFILGTLLTCLVQGILAGTAYLFLGIPSPLLLAVLTAVGGLIPIVGTAIIWLPAALYLYLQGASVKALIIIVWGFLAVGMSDNVIKPIFMSSRVTLPILPIMIGAFGGLAAFGVLGAIFGPLLLALVYELYILEPSVSPDSGQSPIPIEGE